MWRAGERRPGWFRRRFSGVALVLIAMAAATPASGVGDRRLEAAALAHADQIRREVGDRYLGAGGPELAVTEASTTGVVESFSLLSPRLDETRIVDAANGVFYASCPRRARCPLPSRRFARRAADPVPRRQALELAIRTVLETSADVVAVSLPTRRFVLILAEREDLARDADSLRWRER